MILCHNVTYIDVKMPMYVLKLHLNLHIVFICVAFGGRGGGRYVEIHDFVIHFDNKINATDFFN